MSSRCCSNFQVMMVACRVAILSQAAAHGDQCRFRGRGRALEYLQCTCKGGEYREAGYPQPSWLTVLPTEAEGETHKHQEGCILAPCTASLARCLQGVEGVGRQTGLQSPGSPASSGNLLSPGASPGDNLVHPEHMGLSVNVPPLANRAAAAGNLVPWLSFCLAQLQLLGPAWQTPPGWQQQCRRVLQQALQLPSISTAVRVKAGHF